MGAGVAVPLGVVAVAFGLWWISDRLLYIGPLDRASFGWLVVIPLVVAAPIMAGFVWRRLSPRASLIAAGVVAVAIAVVAAALFWQAVAYPGCQFGSVRTPVEWLLPSLTVGLVIGGGLAASGLITATLARGGWGWRAVAVGGAAEVIAIGVAILIGTMTVMQGGCQRPPV